MNLTKLSVLKRKTQRPIVAIALLERLGDLVASEPLIKQIRSLHPRSNIVWIASPRYRELLDNHPGLDCRIHVNSLSECRSLERLFHFEKFYDLHPDVFPCHVFGPSLRKRGGDLSVNMENYYHFQGGLLGAFSRSGGLDFKNESPAIHIPQRIKYRVDKLALPTNFCVAHTRSEDTRRDWRDDHWHRLQLAIGMPIIEVGRIQILDSWNGKTNKYSILETAEIISRARLFIGIDSGPAHLANAVRTRGVILLGAFANFRKYMPYSGYYASPNGATIIRVNAPASAVPFESALQTVQERLR